MISNAGAPDVVALIRALRRMLAVAFCVLPTCSNATASDEIDNMLREAWEANSVSPAEVCSDDTFLRRISLDLIGRIPSLEEIRAFRQNPNRSEKINELLDSDEFSEFWSELWATTLNGYSNGFESDREMLRAWLEQAFREDRPYDQIATRLIAATGSSALDGPVNFLIRHPEQPAVKVCRLFLGVRLDCARCHDHPFDRWTQEDFTLMNRFFEATRREEVTEGTVRLVNRVEQIEEEERPRFLTGARPRTTQWRDEFALFMVNCKPFARAFVNRLWYHFMGRGLVHPVDDFNRENPASIPKLLESLADTARREKFSFRAMIRRICNSKAYQRSTITDDRSVKARSLFAYRLLKPLTAEQAFDSAAVALDLKDVRRERRAFIRRMFRESLDEDLSQTWDYRETVQDLMTRLNANLPVPSQSTEELYLRILSRSPTERELQLCENRRPSDLVFALVNSNEFFFNH